MSETPICRCTIGQHARAAEIDADLRAGGPANSLGKIAERYGCAKPTLGRHRLQCLGLATEGTRGPAGAPETPPPGPVRRPPEPVEDRSRARAEPAETPLERPPETPPETARETPAPGVETPASVSPTAPLTPAPTASAPPEPATPPPAAPPPEQAPRRLGERPPGCPSKEARVKICIDLMVENRWETGVTGGELAAEWGLHPGTVEHDAAEASRYVRRLVDPEVIRTRLSVVLGQALDHGLRMVEPHADGEEVVLGDVRALSGLASIAKVYALLAGAGEKKKAADPAPENTGPAGRFVVDLSYPERPAQEPCPPTAPLAPGTSSPPADDPAPG